MIKHTLQAFFWVFIAHVIVDVLSGLEWLSFLMQVTILRNIVIVAIVYCSMRRKVRKSTTVGPELLPDGSLFVNRNHRLLTKETDKSGVTTRTYSTPDARIVSTTSKITHSSNAGTVLFSTVIAFCAFYLLIA